MASLCIFSIPTSPRRGRALLGRSHLHWSVFICGSFLLCRAHFDTSSPVIGRPGENLSTTSNLVRQTRNVSPTGGGYICRDAAPISLRGVGHHGGDVARGGSAP